MLVIFVLLLVGIAAATVAVAVFAWFHRDDGTASHGPVHTTARVVHDELRRHRRVGEFVRERLSPASATGLALTIALFLVVIVGVLAFEVRRQTVIARFDVHITRWAASHATSTSTRFLHQFTQLGSTPGILIIAVVVAVIAVRRTHRRGIVLFLAVTIVGANLATNLIKIVVGRARPDIHPLPRLSGWSFPSGHSSAAAACFAACALCLGIGCSRRARMALDTAAVALATMVAASRVLIGAHWTSDAFAGLCLGAGWFAICAVAFGGRLLRFGAPVEAASRVTANSPVEVASGS